jgi:protein gp37
MYKTKIDWAESSWNPVTGCLHDCEYCYARSMVHRFGGDTPDNIPRVLDAPVRKDNGKINPYPFGFAPTFHRYRLDMPAKWTEPRTIFVCSMADLLGDGTPDEWWKAVFDAAYAANWHRYLILTKRPERYGDVIEYLETDVKNYPADPADPPSIFLGATATNNEQLDRAYDTKATWLSIEPLRERLLTDTNFVSFRAYDGAEYGRWCWVVIGAETGTHKDKVIPEREWVMEIARECAQWRTPVFMKESLRAIMGDDFRQEYPW